MTREEILNMPAGREMDALIWMVLNNQRPDLSFCRYVDGEYQPHAGYPSGHISPPNYSTDIAAAWEVVEHMKQSGWFFQLFDVVEVSEWMARFTDVPGVGVVMKDARGYGETAPLAICRAALLTTLEEK